MLKRKSAADEMREARADDRVDEREPEHVAIDDELLATDRHREDTGELPEHDAERAECRELFQESHEQLQRQRDELVDILADTLVRVIRVALEYLQAVVVLVRHPFAQVPVCHPDTPFDLQHLTQVDGVDGDEDIEEGQPRELADERPETVVGILLQRVVEHVVPVVDAHEQVDGGEIEQDDDAEQAACLPLLLGVPVPLEQVPECMEKFSFRTLFRQDMQ